MSLDSGTRLGPFEIRGRVDLPGFGEVYAARDHEHQRDVAIHVLRTNAAQDEGVRDRFERDVRAGSTRFQADPVRIHLVGVDPEAIYVVSDPIVPAVPAPAPASAPWAPPPDADTRDARAPRSAWMIAAVVAVLVVAIGMFMAGGDDQDEPEQEVAAQPEVPVIPAPAPVPERELLPPEQTEVRDYVASEGGAPPSRPRPTPPAQSVAPPPLDIAPPPARPAASPGRPAAPPASPAAPPAPVARVGGPPPAPRPAADSRDTTTLITEATVHATEFDLERALALLEIAAGRGDQYARVAALYLRGLIAAREAFREGGPGEALKPVQESMMALNEIAKGRPGAAEIARLMLQAATAAAQSERDEMRLYIESATQMEALQQAAGQSGAPMVSAVELAGDLWLQVHRYEDARRAYNTAVERVGSTLRTLSGLARVARRLNDAPAACNAYRRLVDIWGGRPGLPVEIAEARAYLGGCR